MRIVITTDTVGGVWTFTQELASGLLQQTCAVALLAVGPSPNPAQQQWALTMAETWGDKFCFRTAGVSLEWMQQNDRAYSDAEPVLRSLLHDFSADLLHSNQFCFGAIPVRIPKIITAHSDVLSWHTACKPGAPPASDWLRQYTTLVTEGIHNADAVLAPTVWMLQALACNFRLPLRSSVIPNGRTLVGLPDYPRGLQAATAGRLWDPAKGLDILGHVNSPVPIYVAGETSCEDALAPQAIGAAHLLGPLSKDETLQLFLRSAIYICTSVYEPFGLAPLEAALCGCAVVARDIESLREVWQQGALYFTNPAQLTAILHQLHSDPGTLLDAQVRSRKQAHLYTAEAMSTAYLSIYTSLIKSRTGLAHVA